MRCLTTIWPSLPVRWLASSTSGAVVTAHLVASRSGAWKATRAKGRASLASSRLGYGGGEGGVCLWGTVGLRSCI